MQKSTGNHGNTDVFESTEIYLCLVSLDNLSDLPQHFWTSHDPVPCFYVAIKKLPDHDFEEDY